MDPRPVAFMRAIPQRRQLLAAGIVALIAILLAGLLLARPWDRAKTTAEPTVWQAITAGIRGDSVPLDVALQAFAYLTGVDIPGVRIPGGATGDDAPTSATGALRWVRAHWDELAPDQRAAIEAFTRAGPSDLVLPVTGSRGEPLAGADRVASLGGGPPRGLVPGSLVSNTAAATVGDAIRDDLFETLTHIGQRLGLPEITEGLFLKDVTLTLSEHDTTNDEVNTFWLTQPVVEAGHYSPCNLTVYKNLWSKETPGHPLSATMHVLLTHEVIHCYQYQVVDDVYIADKMPPWIMEGTAIWLAGNDTGIVEPMTPGLWRKYIMGKPENPLTSRTYDAYGWYALLDHLGRPMWSVVADAWRAAARAAGAQRSEAFIAVLDGDAEDVNAAWAPLHARETSWNDPWIPYGLGLPPDLRAPRTPVRATGAGYLASLPDRSNAVYTVTGSDGEIVVVETDGLASAHDGALDSDLAFTSRRFCVDGDCICPPGTRHAGEHVADAEMRLPFVVAFQAPAGGAGQRLSSRTMEQECGRDERSPAPSAHPSGKPPVAGGHKPPRCGNRCPGSNGEPHMRTVDGVPYDFQAVGEFTLLRTPDGTVEIQARQEPIGRRDSVTINTAFAARVNGRRVTIYATSTGLELRLDGVAQTGTDSVDLGGARVQRHATGVELDLADGTVVWVLAGGGYGLFATVDPSPAVVESGAGLIGRSAPGLRIPLLPDGTALPAPKDRHDWYAMLYLRFADAWRVTDATTLFDYDNGKSTASYTIHDYPTAPKVATFQELDPAQVAAGRQACAAIMDTELQDQCAFDVAVTGDNGYVGPYVATALVAQQGTVALDVSIPPTGSPPVAEPAANPPVEVLPVIHQLAGFALAPDGTLYVSAVMADRSGRVLAIDPVTGAILRQVNTTGAGEVDFAAGSVWVGEFTGTTTGAPPCSVSRLDPATLAVQATIPTACHRIWLRTDLAAVSDDVWYVDPTAADASGAGGSLRRIDSATNAVATSVVPLPFADGVLRASATALFYGESTRGQFRLRPGETTLTRIGLSDENAFPDGFPAGDGLWAVANGQLALYTTANGPDGTIDLNDADGGLLVAADAQSVYVERSAGGGASALWRRYLDGRLPIRLAVAPPTADSGIGPVTLLYIDGGSFPTFLVGETSVAKLWVEVSRTDPAESLLLVQGARVTTP
jgi:hypothetical protein